MGKAGRLSRRLDLKVGVENNNKNQKLIKAGRKDEKIVKVVEEMKKAKVKVLRGDEWEVEGKLVLKEEKVYMPKNKELRLEVIRLHHNILVAIHGGR